MADDIVDIGKERLKRRPAPDYHPPITEKLIAFGVPEEVWGEVEELEFDMMSVDVDIEVYEIQVERLNHLIDVNKPLHIELLMAYRMIIDFTRPGEVPPKYQMLYDKALEYVKRTPENG